MATSTKKTGRKTTRRPAPRRAGARAPIAAPLGEGQTFEQDDETTEPGKNAVLADLLRTTWTGLAIVRVERIEIGSQRGWRATFRD